MPTVHAYEDHVFITTQAPYLGRAGHVHLLELDQIIGHHYLVTVHGPINPELDISVALVGRRAYQGAARERAVPSQDPDGACVRRHLSRRAPASGP